VKFRKKPVVIDAVRYPEDGELITDEMLELFGDVDCVMKTCNPPYLSIDTGSGFARCEVGDWVIKGVKGEYYPCKPDIFEATYEPVLEPED
jgi:hypothetical protein